MDKRVILAVAGSGKTTYIVDSLSEDKKTIIVTYTNGNYDNLSKKISEKFCGKWPENILLLTYFQFLYGFCYKPFLSDRVGARGMIYSSNQNLKIRQTQKEYYITSGGYLYSNRVSLLLEKMGVIDDVKKRIETYFDEFIIDEVQDIAGRDFTFLESLMETNVNMLFVGDFYQHTFDTSRDGNVNKSLHDDLNRYEKRFSDKGFIVDHKTLFRSWRCSKSICEFVCQNLGIKIESNRIQDDDTEIRFISNQNEIEKIVSDEKIVKLHFRECYKFGTARRNWGETKGEDHYQDVCVMLNKTTAKLYTKGCLLELKPSTRNKLYVAITRAHRNVYLINE